MLIRIADGLQGAVINRTDDHVVLPHGLVALHWIKIFKPFVLDEKILQQPSNTANLSFDKTAFQKRKWTWLETITITVLIGMLRTKD